MEKEKFPKQIYCTRDEKKLFAWEGIPKRTGEVIGIYDLQSVGRVEYSTWEIKNVPSVIMKLLSFFFKK